MSETPDQLVGIVDIGIGNVRSISTILDRIQVPNTPVTSDSQILTCTKLILPGVGHFGAFMSNLKSSNLLPSLNYAVMEKKIPILGLCVGAQVFLESSEEAPNVDGLGWVSGTNVALETDDSKHFPRIGWDFVSPVKESFKESSVFKNAINPDDPFYFAHSYKFNLSNSELVSGYCRTNSKVVAIFAERNLIGAQFHPEKSLEAGKKFLATFAGWNLNAS